MDEFQPPSFQETESLLESVLSNRRLIRIETSKKTDFIVFSYPQSSDLLASRYMREKALLEAELEGLPSEEDVDRMMEEREIFPQEDQARLEELQEKIEGQKAILERTKIEARQAAVQEVIDGFEEEASKLIAKRESLRYISREKKADEESFLFMAWASAHAITGEKFWVSFEEFEDETDLEFRTVVISEFSKFNRGLTTKLIRFLARHSLWRIRYTAAIKTGAGGSLFSRGLHDLTPDQLALLYWSNYYQSIYEMLPDEQPSEDIIKDDDALDKYMEEYFKNKDAEKKEGKAAGRSQGTTKGHQQKLNAWEKGEELIITPSHPDYMSLAYSAERKKAPEGVAEIEEVSPQSRRARNRRARVRDLRSGKR